MRRDLRFTEVAMINPTRIHGSKMSTEPGGSPTCARSFQVKRKNDCKDPRSLSQERLPLRQSRVPSPVCRRPSASLTLPKSSRHPALGKTMGFRYPRSSSEISYPPSPLRAVVDERISLGRSVFSKPFPRRRIDAGKKLRRLLL